MLAYVPESGDLDGLSWPFNRFKVFRFCHTISRAIGFAETAVLSGGLNEQELYAQVLQDQPSQEIQVQVWQELAQIATEQEATEESYWPGETF